MLPFLDKKKIAASIAAKVTPAGKVESEAQEGEHKFASIAKKLIDAVHAKDTNAVAEVFEELQEIDSAIDEAQE